MFAKSLAISLAGLSLLAVSYPAFSADAPTASKGIGPVKELKLEKKIDAKMAATGKGIFELKCAACHKFDEKLVGPALRGVTQRRQPEWIMNMVLNPQQMIEEDAVARDMFETLLVPMTFQNVTQADVRAILEYFRQMDAGAAK